MKDFMGALDQIANKVGFVAALLVAWMYFQIQDLNDKVEKLETKTEAIAEIKTDLASIKTSVDMILKFNMKEIKNAE